MKVITAVFILAVSGAAFSKDDKAELRDRLDQSDEPRILFVGNSYSFKMPKVLARITKEKGRQVVVEGVTRGGWTLEKHARSKETLVRIREGEWDVVVLQEQSQRPSFSKAQRTKQMIPYVRILASEIRKAGALPVFFQTWGRRDGDRGNKESYPDDSFEKMQGRLITGYQEAAVAAGHALVVPVGEAWAKEMTKGSGKRLFAKDGSHPSAVGVELSARVFHAFFFHEVENAENRTNRESQN